MTTDMNEHRDLEQRLSGWLRAAAPTPAPDLERRIFARTATTEQRRRRTWWSPAVPALAGAAVAAVVLVVIVRLASLAPPPVASPSLLPTPASSASPSPSHGATPSPTGSPSGEPTPSGSPSTAPEPSASPSPAAADPFPDGNRCHNRRDGYSVSYPADWYTNERTQGNEIVFPACYEFAEEPFEVLTNAGTPPWIVVKFDAGGLGMPEEEIVTTEETTVDGSPATVTEYTVLTGSPGSWPEGTQVYAYEIPRDAGETLSAYVISSSDGNYNEHKRVLDLMMESLRFDAASPSTDPTASPSPALADPLPDGNECHNDRYGFTLRYPRDWHTNPAVPSQFGSEYLATCSAFGRQPLELRPNTGYVPPSQAVRLVRLPQRSLPDSAEILIDEERIVDGRTARVVVYRIIDGGGPDGLPTGTRSYEYVIAVDGGRVLIARTDSFYGEDYPEQKRILDLMMQTLVLDP